MRPQPQSLVLVFRLRQTIHSIASGRARPSHPRLAAHALSFCVDARNKAEHERSGRD